MTRLNVQVAVRWASGVPDQVVAGTETFQNIPMLLVLSVTDGDGAKIENLDQGQIHVGYQYAPEPREDSLAVVSDFQHIGPTVGELAGTPAFCIPSLRTSGDRMRSSCV